MTQKVKGRDGVRTARCNESENKEEEVSQSTPGDTRTRGACQEHTRPSRMDGHRVGQRLTRLVKRTCELKHDKEGERPDKTAVLDAVVLDAIRPSLKW